MLKVKVWLLPLTLTFICFRAEQCFGEPSNAAYEMESTRESVEDSLREEDGYRSLKYYESYSYGGYYNMADALAKFCYTQSGHPACPSTPSKMRKSAISQISPAFMHKEMELTGPFAKGRSDEPAQQAFGKTVNDEIGKGITVSYKKNNGSTVHSEIKYYKFNKKAGSKSDGDKSGDQEQEVMADDVNINSYYYDVVYRQSLPYPAYYSAPVAGLHAPELAESNVSEDDSGFPCANPNDPRCQ